MDGLRAQVHLVHLHFLDSPVIEADLECVDTSHANAQSLVLRFLLFGYDLPGTMHVFRNSIENFLGMFLYLLGALVFHLLR